MNTIFSRRNFSALIFFLAIFSFAQIALADGSGVLSGDCENGWGTYRWDNGDQYEGLWKDGQKQGAGTTTYVNGDKYSGHWENDKKNGWGTYTWASGRKYAGQWKDGNREGQGTEYDAEGSIALQGKWENDDYVPTSENEQTAGQTHSVAMPSLTDKLAVGMTKDEILDILGSATNSPYKSGATIDTSKNYWEYYTVDIFKSIDVYFENNKAKTIDLFVSGEKMADETTVSNNIDKIQKGQTIKEMLSILGFPESITRTTGSTYCIYDMGGSFYTINFSSDGLVDSVKKTEKSWDDDYEWYW